MNRIRIHHGATSHRFWVGIMIGLAIVALVLGVA
jgi:hypothetical protein